MRSFKLGENDHTGNQMIPCTTIVQNNAQMAHVDAYDHWARGGGDRQSTYFKY